MVDPKKMSVEEILAACRRADGGGGEEAPAPHAEAAPAAEAAAVPASVGEATSAPAPAPSGKSSKEMSVAEMLAAARAEKSGGSAKPAAAKPSAPAATDKSPKEMSVADMLAAARGEKSGGKPAAEKAAPTPAAKPKPAADKASPKPAAKAAPSGPKDTASILAAARAGKPKPGPITKAEAAAKGEVKPKPAKEKLTVPPLPERPGYARTAETAPAAEDEDRRTFLGSLAAVTVGSSLAVGFSSLAVTHLLWALGGARFMFPNILTEPPTRFKVGFPDEFAPGQVETKFKAQFGVWIVRYEYQGMPIIYALQSVCTHLGCTPNWLEGEQKFKCPCHGSGFYKDGINFEGPAPRPLERFAIRLADDGQLEVDKSRKFLEEKGDWKDPASFVTV